MSSKRSLYRVDQPQVKRLGRSNNYYSEKIQCIAPFPHMYYLRCTSNDSKRLSKTPCACNIDLKRNIVSQYSLQGEAKQVGRFP